MVDAAGRIRGGQTAGESQAWAALRFRVQAVGEPQAGAAGAPTAAPRLRRGALRCSPPRAARRTRPRMASIGLRPLLMLGAQTDGARPIALSDGQPVPAALLGAAYGAPTAPACGSWHHRSCSKDEFILRARPVSAQSRGRAAGRAPLRRRGAQGFGGCGSPQGDPSSAACLSSEHRHAPQARDGHARASSALAPEDRAPQGSRPGGPTAEVKRGRLPAHGFACPMLAGGFAGPMPTCGFAGSAARQCNLRPPSCI